MSKSEGDCADQRTTLGKSPKPSGYSPNFCQWCYHQDDAVGGEIGTVVNV